jgi:hypothetical protein
MVFSLEFSFGIWTQKKPAGCRRYKIGLKRKCPAGWRGTVVNGFIKAGRLDFVNEDRAWRRCVGAEEREKKEKG